MRRTTRLALSHLTAALLTLTAALNAPAAPVRSASSTAITSEIIRINQPWVCSGPVDLDLVRVTMTTLDKDAAQLKQNCTGRVGRLEVTTSTADGLKVMNAGNVAHDLVIEGGFIDCPSRVAGAHQDGAQVMGGYRITLRAMTFTCGRAGDAFGSGANSQLAIGVGGAGASTPTDIVCEGCWLGGWAAHTVAIDVSKGSGARDSTVCPDRTPNGGAFDVLAGAENVVNEANTFPGTC